MAFEMQEQIDRLYSPPEREILEKARKYVVEGGKEVNETISRNTGIPVYHFSKGPDGVFLMPEPESKDYLRVRYGNNVYTIPNFFRGGELGVYAETRNGKNSKFIGIKPKFVEGPYNRKKLEECEKAIYLAKLLRRKAKSGRDGSGFLEFLNDYIEIAKEQRRLMKNPERTARYILTHEPTHQALSDIGVASKIDEDTNEAIAEIVAQDVRGYSLLDPKARYTKLRDWFMNAAGGLKRVYRAIGDYSDVPRTEMSKA